MFLDGEAAGTSHVNQATQAPIVQELVRFVIYQKMKKILRFLNGAIVKVARGKRVFLPGTSRFMNKESGSIDVLVSLLSSFVPFVFFWGLLPSVSSMSIAKYSYELRIENNSARRGWFALVLKNKKVGTCSRSRHKDFLERTIIAFD